MNDNLQARGVSWPLESWWHLVIKIWCFSWQYSSGWLLNYPVVCKFWQCFSSGVNTGFLRKQKNSHGSKKIWDDRKQKVPSVFLFIYKSFLEFFRFCVFKRGGFWLGILTRNSSDPAQNHRKKYNLQHDFWWI